MICGHIHYATIRDEHGIRYMNCGDWVESCTALVEHEDGRFEIISWTDPLRRAAPVAADCGAGRLMRILVATDAWHPQVNGVVRTLTMMAEAAKGFGVDVSFLTPQSFRTFAMPSYPDLRLALPCPAKIARLIAAGAGPTAFTSPPKGRSDCWCGAIAASTACRSPPASTPAFRNTSRRALPIPESLDLGGAALVPQRRARR